MQTEQAKQLRFWDKISWALTAVVLLLVGLMRRPEKLDLGMSFSFLPPLYSGLNALVAVCLVIALIKVKARDITGHRRFINLALIGSILFLLCYVLYHFTTHETKYGGTGALRTVYFLLLISHIILAAGALPFILMAYTRGFFQVIPAHRKLVRWVWPIWFYVAASGPVCYLMLRPYMK
jgi:putative membrane protein